MDDFIKNITVVSKKFSESMVKASYSISRITNSINRSFKKLEIDNLTCGNIDDVDIEKVYEQLMSCNDIMLVLKSNQCPGTLLKVFIGLDVIEIDKKDYTLKIKNKV